MTKTDENGQTEIDVGTPENPEVLPPETDNEDQQKVTKLTSLLQNVQPGWRVSVYRERPSWCRGHLETFEVYDASPINIDDLVMKWGGQALVLKIHNERGRWVGGATIPLYSHQPKMNGQILTTEQVMGFGTVAAPPNEAQTMLAPAQAQAAPPQPMGGGLFQALGMSLPDLLKMMKGSTESENKVYLTLLERQLGAQQQIAQPVAPQPQRTPVDMFKEQIELMTMMREFAGMFGDGGGGGGGDDLTGMLGSIAQGLMNKPQQQPRPRPRPRQRPRPPAQVMPPPPPAAAPPQPVAPVPDPQVVTHEPPTAPQQFDNQPGEFLSDEQIDSMGNSIAVLSPEDASDVVMTAFNGMPDEVREQAMRLVIEKASGQPLDDSSYVDETYSQDEYGTQYDQSQEIPSQSGSPQDQGGPLPTDAGDYPPDRQGDH